MQAKSLILFLYISEKYVKLSIDQELRKPIKKR